ncbi:MAG: hypothetical protein AAF495_19635 [Pseudomonadota bacterium]
MTQESGTVVRLEAAQMALRDHFLGWQCRVRQLAVRDDEGRPGEGMRPGVVLAGGERPIARITVLVVRRDPEESTAQFRHIVRATKDPAERYKNALKVLSATYYQRARDFSDEITALFGAESALADRLLRDQGCGLAFEQFSQRYRLPCQVRTIGQREPAYQATYWHNSLFNPNLPGDLRILGFKPNWAEAEAEPPVG